ncbi:Nucleolar complex protein 3 homolog [Strongyloides ratti]|uniref:NOC3-like protein n=1 Tax=Strongyloides ratti TaxID=34506 RepID=A0A090LKD6_STRRB|nr:Nucleolar complex protein 3 homolog [Strongyloides ratti]CEF70247.1 Nucleolar complex protein 3 homolog [Strongyloides ratti]
MGKIDLNPTRNHLKKTHKRLKKLTKKGKLKKHVRDGVNSIYIRKKKDLIKRRQNIEYDWIEDRVALQEEENENDMNLVPIDMLNSDIDWENTPFKNERKRLMKKLRMEEEESKINDEVPRKFRNIEKESFNNKSLLPIKVNGKVVFKEEISDEPEIKEEYIEPETPENIPQEEDTSKKDDDSAKYENLSSAELLGLRKNELEKVKQHISIASLSIISNPEQNIEKLKELLKYATGKKVDKLIQKDVQKIATASLTEVLIDIIPGYHIREYTEAEMEQRMKKETKALFTFEKTLLEVYKQYLEHLEFFVRPITTKNFNQGNKKSFEYKMGIISNKCLCKLIKHTTHFNFSANIIKLIVRFSVYCLEEISFECCKAIDEIVAADYQFKTSLCVAKEIASVVKDRKGNVPTRLLGTLLHLNIKEVDKRTEVDEKREKHHFKARKNAIHKDRKSKSVSKYEKQLKKLEKDLKEAEAANSLTEKIRFGTDTMKHVFTIYFSVLKRLSKSSLLEPVLEGLAKFAHLINIEFFDDLIASLSQLVQDEDIRVLDTLHCVYTVFVILSGDGKTLNIDPISFYKIMYKKMAHIPFYNEDLRKKCIDISIRCVDIMLNVRRKFVPTVRVAAYVKRLIAISYLLDSRCLVAILALIRKLFISHRNLVTLVECEDDEDEGGSGLFYPEVGDPDCTQAMSSTLIPDLKKLVGHPCKEVGIFAIHILAGCPSTGENRLSLNYVNIEPTNFLEDESIKLVPSPYKEAITKIAKKGNTILDWKNLQTFVEKWLL